METQETIDVIRENLSPFVEAAQEIGGLGWGYMVDKHFWVDGVAIFILTIISSLSFLVLSFSFYKVLRVAKEVESEDSSEKKEEYVLTVKIIIFSILLAVSGIGMIVSSLTFATTIGNIAIPEYYALMDIINGLK